MHPLLTVVALAAARFQSPTSLFQVGEQFSVWILHYRLTKCILYIHIICILHIARVETFFNTVAYPDLRWLLNIYISICSKYSQIIYNSMYLQKNLTRFTHPFLFFRKPLPLRWGATKKHGGTKMSMFSPNQSGVNQLGGWAAWNGGNMVEILPGILWDFATWSNHSKTTTTEQDKKRRKKREKNGSLNLQPPGFFSLASHFSPVLLFFRVVFRLPDLSSRQAR